MAQKIPLNPSIGRKPKSLLPCLSVAAHAER